MSDDDFVKLFDLLEETLNQVVLFIQLPVHRLRFKNIPLEEESRSFSHTPIYKL